MVHSRSFSENAVHILGIWHGRHNGMTDGGSLSAFL